MLICAGDLYKAQGQLLESKHAYLEALRLSPNSPLSPNLLSNLGNVYKELGIMSEAIACYRSAITLQGDHAIALGNLGSCFFDQGDIDLAIQTLQVCVYARPPFRL